ncbi:MAG TPA: molybdenum cofactor biosynthesis protein MoaE [Methanocorpusculum sp.]|nr:molybdenum cofactor biosynthesis protein MoaE [Methanocorpusculum sp.]
MENNIIDGMILKMQKEDIDVGKFISECRQVRDGAQVVFVGCVRDDGMDALEIEAFVPAAEKDLKDIAAKTIEIYHVNSVNIIHRYGHLALGDTILVTIVGASHRGEGYDASRYIIERIKEQVPIWKQEFVNGKKGKWVH